MTEQEMADAILLALNTALAPAVAYEIDTVPVERPERYTAIDVTRHWVPGSRFGGHVDLPGYFLTTEYHAHERYDIRAMRTNTKTALELVTLAGNLGPFEFATADEITFRDGWFDSADTWTFVGPPT